MCFCVYWCSNDGSLAVMWNEWYAHKSQIVSRKLNKLLFFSMMCASPGRVYFAHFVLSQTTINSDATLLWSNMSVRCDNVTPFLRCLLNFTCDNEILRQHCKHFAIYSKTPLQWFNYMLRILYFSYFFSFFLSLQDSNFSQNIIICIDALAHFTNGTYFIQ